jgi:hypothetical protein
MADRRRRLPAAIGILLAGAASMPAQAQSVGDPINELSFSAELRHDSNLARTDEVSASRRSLRRSDERLNVGVSLTLARPLGRNRLSLNAFLGYDFYRRNSDLNRERIAISGALDVSAGPCEVTFKPSVNRQQSELYDIAFIVAPGIDSVRNTQTTQVYRGELRCGSVAGFRPLAYYERSFGDNSNALRQISDYRGETFGGGISYSNPIVGNLDLSVERETLRYPNRPALFGSSGYRNDQIKLAAQREIGAVLTADGFIAFTNLKPKDPGIPGYKGVTWTLGLTALPITDLRLRASLSQTVQPALGNTAAFQRMRDWSLGATYQLGPSTSVSLNGSRSERFYTGVIAPAALLLTRDRLDRIVGGVNFLTGRRLSFGVTAGFERRNANGTIYDYDNTFAALNARFTLGAL